MAALTTVVAALPVFLVGGLAVQLEEDLSVTAAILGLVVAAYWAVAALLSKTAGRVAQRLGARRAMLLAVGLGLTSLLGAAAAAPHWGWLLLWISIGGASNALVHPASNSLIAGQVSIRRRAFAFGLKLSAIPVATFAAGLSVPILALTVGWEWAFASAAVFALLLMPAVLRVVPGAPSARAVEAAGGGARIALPRRLKPFLLATAIAGGLGAAQANTIGAFTVTSALNAGFDVATAGLLLSVASVAACLARPLVGMAADRGIGGSMATVALMLAIGCAGLLSMASGNTIAFGIGAIFAFGFGWGWNGLTHYVVSKRSQPLTAQATGVTQTGTYLGGSVGPLVFGLVFARFGPNVGWTLTAVVAALGAIAALVAYRLEKSL